MATKFAVGSSVYLLFIIYTSSGYVENSIVARKYERISSVELQFRVFSTSKILAHILLVEKTKTMAGRLCELNKAVEI